MTSRNIDLNKKRSRGPRQIEFMGATYTFGNNRLKTYSEFDKSEQNHINQDLNIPQISAKSKKLGEKKRLRTMGPKNVFTALHDEGKALT